MTRAMPFKGLVIMMALVGSAYLGCVRYVTVTVTNVTKLRISRVQLAYTGGSCEVTDLKPRASKSVRIQPTGDSGLVVTVLDSAGSLQSKKAEVYFEQGDRASVFIEIRENGGLAVTRLIRPRGFL
jgi:hypothetical protein